MTSPVGKNWPEIQTVDGSVAVSGGLINVQNPAPMGMPIPLTVTCTNPPTSMVVSPASPNWPSSNAFTCNIPDDTSQDTAVLYSAAGEMPPYRFRDTRGDGDVREFCGGFCAPMRLFWYNPLNYALQLEVVNTICQAGNVMQDNGGTYPLPLGQTNGYIDLPGVNAPSYITGTVFHNIDFKLSCPGGHAEAKYDVELVLLSHYDVTGDVPM